MKRIISFVLCLSMLLSMVPASVFAAEVEETAAAETFPIEETTEATETHLPTETAIGETIVIEAAAEETAAAQVEPSVPETVPETTAAAEVPETTEATVPQETEEEVILREYTYIPDEDFPDSEELFAAYVEQQFYGTEFATFGTAAGKRLPDNQKPVYDLVVDQIRRIAAGDRSSAHIAVGQTLGNITHSDGFVAPYFPDKETDISSFSLSTDAELDVFLSALLADLPYELYWFDKVSGIRMHGTTRGDKTCYVFSFIVAANYSATGTVGTFDVASDKLDDVPTAVANAKAIVEENAHLSDYDKLVAYKDAICDLTSYNDAAANSGTFSKNDDPWQLIHVFDGLSSTKVVCEGYSKAFQYLCDLSEFTGDVTCYCVSGTTSGPHMWNIVSINGQNYLADITNSDTGKVGATGNLFLVGKAPNTNGSYTFATVRFTYNSETTALWGADADSILTLASENYSPSATATPSVMTGEDLVAAMESAPGNYMLTEAVEITSDITLPDDVSLLVYAPASITVRNGATLTVPASFAVANGGKLTVASGSTLIVNDFAIGGGTTCTINGTLINNRRISINYGSLVIKSTGTYSPAENAYLEADSYATVTGISKSLISLFTYVSDEASLVKALVPKDGYASQTAYLMGLDLDYDGILDGPVTITGNITVPEGIELQIGYFAGQNDTVILSEGARLTVDGSLYVISTSTLTIENGAKLINNGTVSSSGTIVNNGIFKGNGDFDQSGTMSGNEYLTGDAFVMDNFLESVAEAEKTGEHLVVRDQITLTEDLTISIAGGLSFADFAKLTVANGATLTLDCPTTFSGAELFVADDAKLVSNAALTINDPHDNGGKAFFLGAFENNGSLWITTGAYVDITGSAVSTGPIFVADDGSGQLTINGQLDAHAYLCVNEGGTLTLSQSGKLNLLDQGGGYLDNQGNTVLHGTVYIEGLMSSGARRDDKTGAAVGKEATIEIRGSVTATDTSTIAVGEGGSIYCYGPLTTAGDVTIEPKGTLWVDNNVTINDPGALTVNGQLHIDYFDDYAEANGVLNLNTTANVNGYLHVADGGVLNVSKDAVLNIKNDQNGCGYLDNQGHVELTGTMNLDGLFSTGAACDDSGTVVGNPADTNLTGSIIAGDSSSIGVAAMGNLTCFGPVTTTGEVTIEPKGTLWVDDTVSITGPGKLTIDGALHVNHFDDGTSAKGVLNVDTETHVNGYWAIHEGGTLTVGKNATVGIYNNEKGCGYLDNNGTTTLNGHLYLEGICTTGAARNPEDGTVIGGPASAVFNWYVDVTETGSFGVLEDGTVTLFGLNNSGEFKTEADGKLIFTEDATLNNHGGTVSMAADTCQDGTFSVQNHLTDGSFGSIEGTPKAKTSLICASAASLEDIQAAITEFNTGKYASASVMVKGNITVSEDITVPEGVSISLIPFESGERSVLTIPEDVTVTNNGTISVNTNTVLVLLGTVDPNQPQNEGGTISDTAAHIDLPDFDHDFFEDAGDAAIYGLWAGSKAVLSPVLRDATGDMVGNEGITVTCSAVDSAVGYEKYATVTAKNGSYTVAALSSLTSRQVIEINFEAEGFTPATVKFHLRPKAEAADIRLDGKTVTGSTITVDVNGDLYRQLSGVITPVDAVPAGADLQWTSSNDAVATVDETGNVTFTGEPGTVRITLTADCGVRKTAAVTFEAMDMPQYLKPADGTVTQLIGGKGASYSVTDEDGNLLNAKDVQWFFMDEQSNLTDSCPYATMKNGKLTTKAVSDPYVVCLQAAVTAIEDGARLPDSIIVTLYPAVATASIRIGSANGSIPNGNLDTAFYSTLQLYANVAPCAESVKSITWKSSKPAVATIDEKTGLLTLQEPGKTKITATVEALDGKKTTATCEFNVGSFVRDITITAVKDNVAQDMNALNIRSGEKLTFSATTVPGDPTTAGVKWSVPATDKAYASINSSGVLTAKNVVNPVTVSVICESKDGNFVKEVSVSIQPKPVQVDDAEMPALLIMDANGEYITKTTVTMAKGTTLQLSGSEAVQNWSSNKPDIVSIDSSSGQLIAHEEGTAKITATTADGRTAEVTIKVAKVAMYVNIITKKAGEPFVVASGKSLGLAAEVTYSDGSVNPKGKVTWTLENNQCGAKISTSGSLSVPKGLTEPTSVMVTATSKESGKSINQTVQIVPAAIGLEIRNSNNVDISNTIQTWDITTQGSLFQLKARVFPQGAMQEVLWKSSSKNVLVDEETGWVTCVKPGTVTITATAADGSGKKASFKLTVEKTMDRLILPDAAVIGTGKSLTLTKLPGFEMDYEASNKTLIWTLTDLNGYPVSKNVATLSNKGVLKAGSKIVSPVQVLVRVETADASDLSKECTVTIYPVTKGIALYSWDAQAEEFINITGKTVSTPLNTPYSVLADTTNNPGIGNADDLTADEFLHDVGAWEISESPKLIVEFFDQRIHFSPTAEAQVGDTIQVTIKARDGSGKSAKFKLCITNP